MLFECREIKSKISVDFWEEDSKKITFSEDYWYFIVTLCIFLCLLIADFSWEKIANVWEE
jgi:hypothetical protein